MKFLVKWQIKESTGLDSLKSFSQMNDEQEKQMRGGVKVVGRWHDLVGRTGLMICESDSEQELMTYALRWSPYMTFQHSIVVDDEGARKVGRKLFAEAAVPA